MKDYTEPNGELVEIPEIVDEFFKGVNMIKVLLVKPKKTPEITEIGSDLESMQESVGGYIEEMMPFEEEIAIVCNSEGKNISLELNRAIRDQNNQIYDIIAGEFFICSASGENFGSLTDEQAQRYYKMFEMPECFYLTSDGIKAISLKAKR